MEGGRGGSQFRAPFSPARKPPIPTHAVCHLLLSEVLFIQGPWPRSSQHSILRKHAGTETHRHTITCSSLRCLARPMLSSADDALSRPNGFSTMTRVHPLLHGSTLRCVCEGGEGETGVPNCSSTTAHPLLQSRQRQRNLRCLRDAVLWAELSMHVQGCN